MKNWKKGMAAALCAVMVMGLAAGCGGSEQSALDKVKEKGVLVWGTNSEFPPFESKNGAGEVVGVDAEIMAKVAEKMGVKLQVEDMEFDSLPAALQSGKIDVIGAGYTEDDERLKEMDFSTKYFKAKQVVVVRKGDTSIKTKDDLKNKKIGVQVGTTGDIEATDIEGAEVSRNASMLLACQDLKNGQVDAVIADSETMKYILQNMGEDIEVVQDIVYDDEYYGLAVKKGESELLDEINAVLQEMIDNGEIDQLLIKYSAQG